VGPDGSVTGIDLSEPMLAVAERRARELGSHARFIEGDVTDQPFEPKHFDLAVSQFGVMFFADPARSLANVFAATKEGGRIAFVCWRASTENPWSAVPKAPPSLCCRRWSPCRRTLPAAIRSPIRTG
jgi:ubiquinone/menaquinone biosynthesis C-methylase UbiE